MLDRFRNLLRDTACGLASLGAPKPGELTSPIKEHYAAVGEELHKGNAEFLNSMSRKAGLGNADGEAA